MLKSRCFNITGSTGLILSLVILFSTFLCMSCATVEPPKDDYQLKVMEKQVIEIEKKIDEIHHRVSVIQFMVDNHERYINDLEKSSEAAETGDGVPLSGLETGEDMPIDRTGPDTGLMTEDTIPPPLAQAEAPELNMKEPKPQPAPDLTGSPQMLYSRALSKYKSADYKDAAALFESFVEQYPTHELADNALYWEGECRYAVKNFSQAIVAFQRVINDYPEGSKVPDAMLKTGYSYLSIDDKENARIHLQKVVKNYLFSPSGTKAEMMLKKMK